MQSKLRVVAAILLFSLLGLVVSNYSTVFSPGNSKSVLGVSEGPIYIPNNYKQLGIPYALLPLDDGSVWFFNSLDIQLVKASNTGEIVRTVGKEGNDIGEFNMGIRSMTEDTEGNIYGLSSNGCRIYKLDSNGGEIKRWEFCGEGEGESGEWGGYNGIAYSSTTNKLYVTDSWNQRIHVFTTDGVYSNDITIQNETVGDLSYQPEHIEIGPSGKIYVYEQLAINQSTCDGSCSGTLDTSKQHRIDIYNSNGTPDTSFHIHGDTFSSIRGLGVTTDSKIVLLVYETEGQVAVYNSAGTQLDLWGEYGTNSWQFVTPSDLEVDDSNNVWVNNATSAVQKFSIDGTFISAVRNSGTVTEKVTFPSAVAYDSEGNTYVLDNGEIDPRIQKFTNEGVYLETIVPFASTDIGEMAFTMRIYDDKIYVGDEDSVTIFDLEGTVLDTFGSAGTGDGQFDLVRGLAVDSLGNIYVADAWNHRIQKFNADGDYVSQWGESGIGNDQLMYPTSLFIDGSDKVYVGETANMNHGHLGFVEDYEEEDTPAPDSRIKVFTSSGVYERTIDATSHFPDDGSASGIEIADIALNADGNIAISYGAFTVATYTLDGEFVSTLGTYGSGLEEYWGANGLALNPILNIMTIADTGNHRLQILPPGVRIYNLNPSADVLEASGAASLTKEYYNPVAPSNSNITSTMYFGDYAVSDFSVNLTAKRDWEDVVVVALPEESLAFVNNLDTTGAPGISATHSLLVPKQSGQNSVRVCPDAEATTDVTTACLGGYTLQEGDANLSIVTIDDQEYWKVSNLTGTGIVAYNAATVTPTPTVTATPTSTPTPTPSATPTTPSGSIIGVTLMPVALATPVCPSFTSFSASTTFVQAGQSVTLSWATINTDLVRSEVAPDELPAIGTYTFVPTKTTEVVLRADNGSCNARKTVTISVVDQLPWVNTATIGTGILLVEAAIALQQPFLFGNIWLGLLSAFDRKRKRSWGFVYDSTTKKAVSRAVVRLLDASGKVVDTVVSEANGTFKLTPKVGTFKVTVTHPQYSFPSRVLVGDTDQGYTNVYLGGEIKVTNANEGLLLSIPLDSKELTEFEIYKLRTGKIISNVLSYGSLILLAAGALYSAYVAVVYPHPFNWAILGVYAVLSGLKIYFTLMPLKTAGKVIDVNGKIISGVELGLFEVEFNTLKYRTFTSATGEYSFLVPDGNYALKVMDKRYHLLQNGKKVEFIDYPKSKDVAPIKVIAKTIILGSEKK